VLLDEGLFRSVNSRLILGVGVQIETVQVVVVGVKPEVTSGDAIWIEEWYDFENEVF
jgi:hypothetical protein